VPEGRLLLAALVLASLSPVAHADAPHDEVLVPAGEFSQGASNPARQDEGPPHRVRLHAFRIDATLVTRRDFAAFVARTGFLTTAETLGFGMVAWDGMDDWEWQHVPGATWRKPVPDGTPGGEAFVRDDAPVVMVTYDDAEAYCHEAHKRLPTEAEWEYAMRAGSVVRFPWGDSPRGADGAYRLNFFQGESHHKNLVLDGYLYVSPVRAFPPNAWGIYDAVGNVWQWTADRYSADTYARAAASGTVTDPRGPADGDLRVLRGGSWWCGVCTCEGYGLVYRGKASPRAPYNNNGFRCARD
jgi:sulfatase modifying factor 1